MTGPAFTKPPRFNHIAMSVPADALDAAGRAAVCAFYGDVFGFEEYEDLTKDRHMLVLRAHHHEQFVFLIAEDEPMRAPRMDHVGMSVSTLDDFNAVLDRARAWKEKLPDEVHLIESKVEEYVGALNLHSFYVGYRLPLLFELQHFEYLF
ncbi:MAG TPA: VOC family protein [Acidimicrobiales bacterium]|nr:VOC family protein [Acidimicrobiales bacterium]